jgi:hypothetical protein
MSSRNSSWRATGKCGVEYAEAFHDIDPRPSWLTEDSIHEYAVPLKRQEVRP